MSAQDDASLEIVANTYELVAKAGIHRASSIKVAEAAKVIENVQRDLNIALMNELEEENRRLKKLYVEAQIKADIVAEALAKKL